MIGVICERSQEELFEELFQLFKTPWQMAQKGQRYAALVSTCSDIRGTESTVTVAYGVFDASRDARLGLSGENETAGALVSWREWRFPVYGELSLFSGVGSMFVRHVTSGRAVGIEVPSEAGRVYRIGIDLPLQVVHLLSVGQPCEWAGIPTMEIHISMLRALILSAGVPLVEIPPSPPGAKFMVSLTHDVDFAGARFYRLDRTIAGFLLRATFGSVARLMRGDLTIAGFVGNLAAAVSLPLVYLGAAPDFFDQFRHYARIEGKVRSTFFLIPFKNRNGRDSTGRMAKGRACRYDLGDIDHQIRALVRRGCEVGLHALDGWRDTRRAAVERRRVMEASGCDVTGVRMHWLFGDESSPAVLEAAGFEYDSSFGYNECVGFRAGTSQVYRPPKAQWLLELPLHLMDTALFYRGRMGLTQRKAREAIEDLFREFQVTGGVLTLNWHDRSIGPERFWNDTYRHILGLAASSGCWTGTAGEVVRWFRKRRSAVFLECDPKAERIRIAANWDDGVPDLVVRIHTPEEGGFSHSADLPSSRFLKSSTGDR